MATKSAAIVTCVLAMLAAGSAVAQSSDAAPADTTTAPAASDEEAVLSAAELEQLVAPIALYPDQLLADVLMASTYPLEVIEADRWAKKNKSLKGEKLAAALDKQTWDESVKSVVGTPSVLDMMSEQLEWTRKLGDTMLAQQADLMDAVQRLRLKAQDAGQLKTTKEQIVTVSAPPPATSAPASSGSSGGTAQEAAPAPVITIAPAEPENVYVPYYDPGVVYGGWDYPSYPPYYWPPAPGYYAGAAIATGIAFGVGAAWIGAVNGGFDWHNHDVNIDIDRNFNKNKIKIDKDFKAGKWEHNPKHRGGVRYSNGKVDKKFSKGNIGSADERMDFRGKGGNQVIKVGEGNLGNKGGGNLAANAKGGNLGDRGAGNVGGNLKGKGGANVGANVKGKGGNRPSPPKKTGGGAFAGIDKGGAGAKASSNRGKQSIKSYNSKGKGGGKVKAPPKKSFKGGGGGKSFKGGGGGRSFSGGGGRGGFGGGGGRGGGGRRR